MRKAPVVIVIFLLLWPYSLQAGPSTAPTRVPQSDGCLPDLIPLAISSYKSGDEALAGAPMIREEPLHDGLLKYSLKSESPNFLQGEAEESSGRKYLPVLFSLLVPGTGEIALGYYGRGAVLLAAEVVAWAGYAHYHNKGLDSREEYERFADAHWNYDRWVFDHPANEDIADGDRTFESLDSIGRCCWDEWPGYHTWHSKEEEELNYYENIGKYDWFISGWEDWDPLTKPHDTALRDTYRLMRTKSNDELDNATRFIFLSITARVVSLIDTVLLTRRNDSDVSERDDESNFSIRGRATGLASGEIALVYRFK